MEVENMSKNQNEPTDPFKDDLTTEDIKQLAKEETDKTFSTFESNRREKEKAEEMMPESFEESDVTSADEETT